MIPHRVYIKRTHLGYYVCYSALYPREINVNPIYSIVPAMELARKKAFEFRTHQRTINVRDYK